ncbi:hypothetical protein [Pseudonocardia sp.]|uniref:hypothetical protein n=1 Tax=Pseudonocardia sp. TaxID=60912 RepID=UPI003D0C6D5B
MDGQSDGHTDGHADRQPDGPPADPPRRRHRTFGEHIGVVAAVLGVVVAVVAWLWPQAPPAEGPSGPRDSPGRPAATAGDVQRTPRLGLEFWQGDTQAPMFVEDLGTPVVRVALRSEPFEIRFPRLPSGVALQVCAWTDRSILVLDDGVRHEDVPFLRPGTGFADHEFGSGTLFVDPEGQNYLIDTRVRHRTDDQDSFFVSRLDGAGSLGSTDVYLAVTVDRNRDDVVDSDEYEYVQLDIG